MRYTFIFLLMVIFCNQIAAQDLSNLDTKKPLKLSGSLVAQSIFYQSRGIQSRRKPFSYILMGNLNADILGVINVPISFTYSEQQRSFTQPFNQFGMSPQYKKWIFHLGYRSLNWGQFSLAGYNCLMAGVETEVKNIRIGAMYGRLNKATRPDTIGETANVLPTYRRMGFAGKVGYGKVDNFIDLVFFKAQDIGDSIAVSRYYSPLRPAENEVVNIITKQKFLKFFTARAEIAFSSTNYDKFATGPAKYDEGLGLLKVNNSGGAGKAFIGVLGYQKKSVRIEIGTKQTSLDFKSFGGYQYNTNYSVHHFLLSYALAKNKIRITHSGQLLNDNLNGLKAVTTKRLIPSTKVDWQYNSVFGLNVQYNLVKSTQKLANAGNNAAALTPRLLNQLNHVVTVVPRLIFKTESKQQMFMLMQTFQKTVDNNQTTKLYSENKTSFTNLLYNLNYLKTGLGFSSSIFYTTIKNYAINFNTKGINGGVNKSLNNGKTNIGFNTSYSTNKQQNTINNNLTFGYKAKKHHSISANIGTIFNNSKTSNTNFSEFQGRLMYQYNF